MAKRCFGVAANSAGGAEQVISGAFVHADSAQSFPVELQTLKNFSQSADGHFFDQIGRDWRCRSLPGCAGVRNHRKKFPRWLCRGLDQSCQCGLYRSAEIGISEVWPTQPQSGGNAP